MTTHDPHILASDPRTHIHGPIHVTDYHDQPDAGRFVKLFRSTWRQIPLGPRRKMLAHWRHGSGRTLIRPDVWLCPYPCPQGGIGECRDRGHSLVYDWGRLAARSDDDVQTVVAHELAHVHQWATGDHEGAETHGDLEEWADETVEGWGFRTLIAGDTSESQIARYLDRTPVRN